MYVKLFGSIVDSSLWSEPEPTRIVFITMLATADGDGYVRGVPSSLARRANVSEAACCAALEKLEAPDPESGSDDHEGRRIETVGSGWRVLNYKKYRETRTQEQLDAARRQRDYYHRQKRQTSQTSQTDTDKDTHTPPHPTTPLHTCPKKRNQDWRKDDIFLQFKAAYPKRAGGHSPKEAYTHWLARVKEGVEPEVMIRQAKLYARFVEATDRAGSRFVKAMENWLAPRYAGWDRDWTPPDEPMSELGCDLADLE